jgi:hypothetical protein
MEAREFPDAPSRGSLCVPASRGFVQWPEAGEPSSGPSIRPLASTALGRGEPVSLQAAAGIDTWPRGTRHRGE